MTKEDIIVVKKIFTGNNEANPSNRADFFANNIFFMNGKVNKKMKGYKKQYFYYINNPDKSIRWVIPSQAKYPRFLNFYFSGTRKAKVYQLVFRLLYMLKLKKLASHGSFTVFFKGKLNFQPYVMGFEEGNYSIFTGTSGKNRKAVIETGNGPKADKFIKMAISVSSKNLIENEKHALNNIKSSGISSIQFPMAEHVNSDDLLLQSAINTRKGSVEWSGDHSRFLVELQKVNNGSMKINEWLNKYLIPIRQRLHMLIEKEKDHPFQPYALRLFEVSGKLISSLNKEAIIKYSFAHGDFTPWNTSYEKGKLGVFDWELAMKEAPLLYDFFHFLFQGSILLKNHSYKEIRDNLKLFKNDGQLRIFLNNQQAEPELYLKLYLIFITTYYSEQYLMQETMHHQAFDLADTWYDAALSLTREDLRDSFIKDLFFKIRNIPYTIPKFSVEDPTKVGQNQDIDLLINKENAADVIAFIKKDWRVTEVKISKKPFMKHVEVVFENGEMLMIDLIHSLQRKGFLMMEIDSAILKSSVIKGVNIASKMHQAEYLMLFYFLNKADIPTKYRHLFEIDQDNSPIRNYLENKYQFRLQKGLQYNPLNNFKIKKVLQQSFPNGWFARQWRMLQLSTSSLIIFIKNKGQVITFSGVDGAGKTTVINEFKKTIEKKYRKRAVVLRHRPSLLPILSSFKYGREGAEQRSVASLPRTGGNKSRINSLIRFTYYLTDYILGQWVIAFKYILRGYIVIYDRYYFDFIVDPRRTNLTLSPRFTKIWYRFIFKPRLNFFLYADAETILSRKKELNADDIQNLTTGYIQLFRNLKGNDRYFILKNDLLNETMKFIENQYHKVA